VGKNGDLSTAALVLNFLFLHQVPEFCTHVVLILCFLNHITFFPASCLGCSFNKETLLKFQLACVQPYPLSSHFMSSTIFPLCLPSYSNGVCSKFLHITDHAARFHTVPFSRKRISITSILINEVMLKICDVSFQTPCLYGLMHSELRLVAVI